MEHLSDEQRQRLSAKLQEERARIVGRIVRGRQEVELRQPDSGDAQDAGADETSGALAAVLSERERARVAAIDAAFERMASGEYGICGESGDPIPFARLWIEPTTMLSVEAQEDLERERARTDHQESGGQEGGY